MEIILRTTKFDLPPPTKPVKTTKTQELAKISKFLPPLKAKPQVNEKKRNFEMTKHHFSI